VSSVQPLPRARRLARGSVLGMIVGCALAGAVLATGCASSPVERPAPLAKIRNQFAVRILWHRRLRGQAPALRLGLGVAVAGGRVFAASHSGIVEAFALSSGRRLWRRKVRAPLSGGPGTGAGLVVLGSSKGDVIALSQTDGRVHWRRRVNSEILSAPAVGDDFTVVRGVDGRLEALSTAAGTDTWIANQEIPRLSLRGTSRPILVGDLAICGFDDGHVLAVDRNDGMTAWDAAVGEPHGTSELQRLIDIDSPVVSVGDDLFAVAYQGRVARLVRDSGRILWTHDQSSYRGLAVDGGSVYVSDADGNLVRLNAQTGTVVWQVRLLANRELSAPVVYHGRLVVGDLQGYLHWFDPATGRYLARVRVGKQRISAAPVIAGDTLVVFDDGGQLTALRTPPPAAAASR
jgi:outer membrane protein assembly factor BamB